MSQSQLLRFLTAGSVDDGKSTLIGRLLYDCHALPTDQLAILQQPKNLLPDGSVNLALLTDGLRAEREQGITIDVAYKYFATPTRKYIIADSPGHVQYTRNMVTGASNSDLVVLLVDARAGLSEQTRRHAFLATLLGIRHLVVAINKMDLVDWSRERFDEIRQEFLSAIPTLQSTQQQTIPLHIEVIPLSALKGDNVARSSEHTSWYAGPTLLEALEHAEVQDSIENNPARFPIQTVIRPQSPEYPDFRGYAGRVASGRISVGDKIIAHPSLRESTVTAIYGPAGEQKFATSQESITLTLADQIDLSRGDLITLAQEPQPTHFESFRAWIAWFDEVPFRPGSKWILRHGPRQVHAIAESIDQVLDLTSLTLEEASHLSQLGLNTIAQVTLTTASPLPADIHTFLPRTGRFILVHEGNNRTVGAGILLGAPQILDYSL